jgi:hypothetical protein
MTWLSCSFSPSWVLDLATAPRNPGHFRGDRSEKPSFICLFGDQGPNVDVLGQFQRRIPVGLAEGLLCNFTRIPQPGLGLPAGWTPCLRNFVASQLLSARYYKLAPPASAFGPPHYNGPSSFTVLRFHFSSLIAVSSKSPRDQVY